MLCLKQHPTALCPPEYMVCFLHRLIAAVRLCWDEGARKISGSVGSEGTAFPPPAHISCSPLGHVSLTVAPVFCLQRPMSPRSSSTMGRWTTLTCRGWGGSSRT